MQWKSAICVESPNNKMWHSVVLSHIHLFNHICKFLNSTSNRAILSLLFQYFWMALCVYIYIYIYIYIYTLTGHFIRYTLRVPGWTPFCLQNYLNYSWHRFNKVLETLLKNFGPYWHDSITQLLQNCRLHIHYANLPFHHIPKVLYCIEIWWLWRPFEWSELIAMFKKPVWDDVSFVTLYTVVIKGWTWSATILR